MVSKLRFHIASTISQKWIVATQKGSLKFKDAAHIMFRILQIPCNMKGPIFKCRRCHAKRDFLSSQCRLTLQNAKILQIPRKLCCLFLRFFGLDGFVSFLSSWLCNALQVSGLHGFVCVHLFIATKATLQRKSQTQPTPKQRPQHQQLYIVISMFLQLLHTTTNSSHNSNSNNNSNNKKKLLCITTTTVATAT